MPPAASEVASCLQVPLRISLLQEVAPRQVLEDGVQHHPSKRLQIILWPALSAQGRAYGTPLVAAKLAQQRPTARVAACEAEVYEHGHTQWVVPTA
eukprot:CAMPEP_0180449530 /NCGR_PEP_ID=MMETSP1036_2-20121128/17772_1 /TAXON_ID=632150 /ORGANISM="Azadinium spinosum, Strain 3D9" /LENGTH=95 /DNA_ID=CAMNT_0022455945 /DNA_START=388 /DNA_END=676 /DNA_ORIENTATION=-